MPPSLTEVRLSYKGIVMVCFCFTASVVCYVDRTNISVAIVAMARDYEWGDAQRSLVLSSFFIGYMTTQVLGGVLSLSSAAPPRAPGASGARRRSTSARIATSA